MLASYNFNMSKHVGSVCGSDDYDEDEIFKDVENKRLPLVRIKFAPIKVIG